MKPLPSWVTLILVGINGSCLAAMGALPKGTIPFAIALILSGGCTAALTFSSPVFTRGSTLNSVNPPNGEDK